ncbi:MAG: response regulator, partial [Magnetococcales bacterium]|nr:response regulator [Magnetococcales bacterium]
GLEELVEVSCDVMALRAHSKGLEIAFHIDPDLPVNLEGDPNRLRQILLNLFGNAIKFTHEGEIVLTVESVEKGRTTKSVGEPIMLSFSVRDTGIGIPSEKAATIFNAFTQVDASVTRRYGGSGLGLSICQRLCRLMGGDISMESLEGHGSTFRFTARFIVGEASRVEQDTAPFSLEGYTALIVDDTEVNRIVVREALKSLSATILECSNGYQALDLIKQSNAKGSPVTLLMMDCRMPGMDGFECVETLKRVGAVPPLVMMLTSDNRVGDHERCLTMGIQSYLVKPIKRRELHAAISTLVQSRKTTDNAVPVIPPPGHDEKEGARRMRILVAEDAEDNRFLLNAFIDKTPHHVTFAEHGEQVVELFKKGGYDLVLMDMQMPVMDGFSATRVIRQWEQERQREPTPIVALTAYALEQDIRKSLDAGCDDHISKPYKKRTLLEMIDRFSIAIAE